MEFANEKLKKVRVKIKAVLGETSLTLEEISKLEDGSIIQLEQLLGGPIAVYAGDNLIANAEVVAVDDCFGIRICRK
ncbi:MAG TPA: flagellar motor switch protein FliN [Spirochaetia bacterium]|nr:flagellar motor switch protein FliN [Spirochaetia bacterium]